MPTSFLPSLLLPPSWWQNRHCLTKKMTQENYQAIRLWVVTQRLRTSGLQKLFLQSMRAFSIVENVAKARPRMSDCCSRISSILLLQPLWWRCVECVIHHEWDVREEQQYIYWGEQAIIEWSRRTNSIAACCHSAKLCAHAVWAFPIATLQWNIYIVMKYTFAARVDNLAFQAFWVVQSCLIESFGWRTQSFLSYILLTQLHFSIVFSPALCAHFITGGIMMNRNQLYWCKHHYQIKLNSEA